MKIASNHTKSIRAWAYISPAIKKLLIQRAADENNSESFIITKALTMYLMKDTTNENELIAKMSEIIRVMQNLSDKIEVGQKLNLEWIQTSFMFTPELSEDKAEQKKVYELAAKRMEKFLSSFRRREKMLPQFLEGIFGGMLEEEKKG
jgi:predicted DNA-binding protein (UPF0278 family)